jgi:hypothetical protein
MGRLLRIVEENVSDVRQIPSSCRKKMPQERLANPDAALSGIQIMLL